MNGRGRLSAPRPFPRLADRFRRPSGEARLRWGLYRCAGASSFEGESLAFRYQRARHGPLAAPKEPGGARGAKEAA
jgi:hypothetical protein